MTQLVGHTPSPHAHSCTICGDHDAPLWSSHPGMTAALTGLPRSPAAWHESQPHRSAGHGLEWTRCKGCKLPDLGQGEVCLCVLTAMRETHLPPVRAPDYLRRRQGPTKQTSKLAHSGELRAGTVVVGPAEGSRESHRKPTGVHLVQALPIRMSPWWLLARCHHPTCPFACYRQ